MKIINASYEILSPIDGDAVLKHIEQIGRVCYKSEAKITAGSSRTFVASLIKSGHEAVIEHFSFSVKFICDRGVSHEIVRHRIASFAQESTRYCDYSKVKFDEQITVIKPLFPSAESKSYYDWLRACETAEKAYFELLRDGVKPEDARAVLPNGLKTELVMTANLREWRHFLKLRTANAAHPQIRELARPLLTELQTLIPVIFDDIKY